MQTAQLLQLHTSRITCKNVVQLKAPRHVSEIINPHVCTVTRVSSPPPPPPPHTQTFMECFHGASAAVENLKLLSCQCTKFAIACTHHPNAEGTEPPSPLPPNYPTTCPLAQHSILVN